MIKAVILAAGLGTRLKPMTDSIPKPLIKIRGKPIIDWVLEVLLSCGIKNICVNVHYYPQKISGYLGDKVTYYPESKLSGTAGVLKRLEDRLADPFIVVNGDTISNVDIKEMLKLHKKEKADLTVFTLHDEIRSGGCYVMSKYILNFIPENKPYSIHKDLIPKLQKDKRIKIVTYKQKDGYYFDIGTHEGLEKARRFFEVKRYVYCPQCEARGEKNVLGELDEEGNFVVLRFRKGLTKISGESFSVLCDKCHEPVFYRKKNEK